ncbi:MAG TPA: septal ring lytic transglycosylase RlpA family protein [Terriglobales bacterium]|nr:septal ring lytic transglycosylase RlpA family protein [Terriglobales bacterium]
MQPPPLQRLCAFLILAVALVAAPAVAHTPLPVAAAEVVAPRPAAPPPPARPVDPLPYQVGLASWYGSYFQGRETTSGEPFNMYAMTAAHRQLPLGTRVRVTNLENRRSVVLRINDRGPVPTSRTIDVSYAAACALGFRVEGLVPVRIDLLPPPRR